MEKEKEKKFVTIFSFTIAYKDAQKIALPESGGGSNTGLTFLSSSIMFPKPRANNFSSLESLDSISLSAMDRDNATAMAISGSFIFLSYFELRA